MPLTTRCPACDEPLEVDDEYRTWRVRCPHCRHEFVPVPPRPGPPPPRPGADPFDDEPPRPRRGRRPRYRDPDEVDVEAAADKVSAPATCLAVLGWGMAALCLAAGAICAAVGAEAAKNPKAGGVEPEVMYVLAGCLIVLGVPYHAVIGYGAGRLRRMSGQAWPMTAAVLAIMMFLLAGVCGVLHAGFGIWALVALLDRQVQAVIRMREAGEEDPEPARGWDRGLSE